MLVSLSEFPRRVRCCPRGLALNLSCLWQVSNLAPKRRTIADHVFLQGPASDVGLGEFHCIDVRCSRHNRNQFGCGWPRFRWLCLPVLPPPGEQARIFIGVFFWWRTGNLTTQVTDEGNLQREHLLFLIG